MHLHTVTKVCDDQPFGYFLQPFHLLIEIYPLVPFPPSVCEEEPVYTSRVRGWGPVTSATTNEDYTTLQLRRLSLHHGKNQ